MPTCDCCDKQSWTVFRVWYCGIETFACAECRGVPDEESCPGHVASENDPKVCGRCGVHIDSLRPPDDGDYDEQDTV